MRRSTLLVLLLLIPACSFFTHTAEAQTYACAAETSEPVVSLREYAVRLTGGDPSLDKKRQAYQLPKATSSQIRVVKTKSVCRQAAQAYNKAVRGASAPQVSRSVAVIKVGSTRYLVTDPAEREGEFGVTVIFDASFAPLLAFNS
jgi:hypothetical protein